MVHDDWEEGKKQNIRKEAVDTARKIHLSNMKSFNKNMDLDEEDIEPMTVFTEEVIESASMIEEYIEKGEAPGEDI